LFERLLVAKPENVAGAPCVKVIIDFTSEAQEIDAFEPDQVFSRGGHGGEA
jgi:hypothetical protein